MLPIPDKLPNTGTTIFTVMSALANEHGAINLSQGFPDFEPPQPLRDRVNHHLNAGHNQYPPMMGIEPLRARVAEKVQRLYGVSIDRDSEVTVTSGATEALFCAIHALVAPGDEVIVFDPAYDSYEPAVRLAGGKVVHIPLAPPNFALDVPALAASLGSRTRLVIINTPHNPTGSMVDQDMLDQLAEAIAPYECWVLSDEVYEHIVFPPNKHASVLAHPELRGRSLAVFSFGKTYHATGWKVGYCVAPPSATAAFRRVHQFNNFTTPTPLQWALADYMEASPEFAAGLGSFYQEKRDYFRTLLDPSRFSLLPCRGTYFQLADYSAISNDHDETFCRWLTESVGVAAIPVSVFYDTPPDAKLVRFCFAKEAETLEEAAERLCKI